MKGTTLDIFDDGRRLYFGLAKEIKKARSNK